MNTAGFTTMRFPGSLRKLLRREIQDRIPSTISTVSRLKKFGVRVPAIVVSPLIPRNLIDHRIYDHSPVNEGNLPAILHSAMRQDLETSPPEQRQAIVARVQSIKTRAQAMEYMKEVQQKVRPRRLAATPQ